MLLVKTYLGLSNIHRIGIFAGENIRKGTVIWRYEDGYDLKIPLVKFNTLPQPAKAQILHYGYLHEGFYVLCSDDSRYFNHSANPNTEEQESPEGEGITVALVDIEKGDELTCNYRDFDEDKDRKLGYDPSESNHPDTDVLL